MGGDGFSDQALVGSRESGRGSTRAAALAVALLVSLFAPSSPSRAQTWVEGLDLAGGDDSGTAIVMSVGARWIVAGMGSRVGRGDDGLLASIDARGRITWAMAYGGPSAEWILGMARVSPGRYIMAGSAASFGSGLGDAWIFETGAQGTVVWARAYGGDDEEWAEVVRTANSDGFFVGGHSDNQFHADFLVLRIDRKGDLLWQAVYGIPGQSEHLLDLAVTPDGGAILVGDTSYGEDSTNHALAVKIDAGGAIEWQRTYRIEGDDVFRAVALTGDGEYVMAGQTRTSHSALPRAWLLRLDAAGQIVWHQEYPLNSTRRGGFYDVTVLAAGNLVAAGVFYPIASQPAEAWVISADAASGMLLWQRSYGDFDLDRVEDSYCDEEGGCIFTGLSRSFVGLPYDNDVFLLRTDDVGAVSPDCSIASDTAETGESEPVTVEPYPGIRGMLEGLVVREVEMTGEPVILQREEICFGNTLYAPTEVSPRESLTPVRFVDLETLQWEEATASAANTFDLYRGDVDDLGAGPAGRCLLAGLTDPTASDPEIPAAGTAWFYEVGGRNGAGVGMLGVASNGDAREVQAPCN